jgi:hypothetical protein
MKPENLIINTVQEFDQTQQFIQSVFDTRLVLPQQIFSKEYSNFTLDEYDWTLCDEFWEVIQQLSQLSGDTDIIMAIIDPDPITYYHKKIGYLKLPTTLTAQEYSDLLWYQSKEHNIDQVHFIANVVAWVPLSRKWAIWGERTYEVCILGFADQSITLPNNILKGKWRPLHEALEDFIFPHFRTAPIPLKDADAFIANYSNK